MKKYQAVDCMDTSDSWTRLTHGYTWSWSERIFSLIC